MSKDALSQWPPAFLSLGKSLDECAAKYRKFCKKYKPKAKSEKSYSWGIRLLPKVLSAKERKRRVPGQMSLPFWDDWSAVRAIKIIGEATANVSSECRERHPQIPWADIR